MLFEDEGVCLLDAVSDKPVERIRPGDWVACVPESDPYGPCEFRQVLRVFANGLHRIFNLHVAGQIIGTTAGHPFQVCGRGWTQVKDLRPGDELAFA